MESRRGGLLFNEDDRKIGGLFLAALDREALLFLSLLTKTAGFGFNVKTIFLGLPEAVEFTLLENMPLAPAEKGQRNRFPNRCPATATNGLALRHRVFQPAWQPLWYRLIFPTGTNDIFPFFPKSSFVCYIYYCLFFYNC